MAGALENGERGLQAEGRRGIGAGEQLAQGVERDGRQFVELLVDAFEEMVAGLIDSVAEFLRGSHPIVDGAAVNSGSGSGAGDGASLGERGDDLDLDGRQVADLEGWRSRRNVMNGG
jgi:hypothetical protein